MTFYLAVVVAIVLAQAQAAQGCAPRRGDGRNARSDSTQRRSLCVVHSRWLPASGGRAGARAPTRAFGALPATPCEPRTWTNAHKELAAYLCEQTGAPGAVVVQFAASGVAAALVLRRRCSGRSGASYRVSPRCGCSWRCSCFARRRRGARGPTRRQAASGVRARVARTKAASCAAILRRPSAKAHAIAQQQRQPR